MVGKVLLLLAFVGCAAAALQSCKQGGDYCQNHWECCTNTCLSFLYKCSRVQPKKEPDAQLSNDLRAPIDKVIELAHQALENESERRNAVVLRFGTEDETPSILPRSNKPSACKRIGEKCYFNGDCCSARCHGFLHQCVT